MPLPDLIERLLDPAAYPHPAAAVRLIETHISWVFIAGEYAYKIKKPVDFGFLDFSTLAKRRFCCDEEVRLNRRLAPDIYLDVVPVTEQGIGGAEALEWAVRMRAFPADATLDREAAVTPEQIDAIADRVARFHGEIERAPEASPYGAPESAMHPVQENFRQIRALPLSSAADRAQIERLEAWSEQEYRRLHDHLGARKAAGYIRECHGDLHLGNIAWVQDAPLIFDCIEFNPNLRFIDVISEVAFFCMDLIARGREALAWRFLNRWLEHTGDYAGLAGLRFYMVYRAVVRAKVAGLRAAQGDRGAGAELQRYLDLAERLGRPGHPALLLMHGYSGSGKTWLSQRLLEDLGALRLRSDVERKRLHALHALADSKAAGDIYTPAATRHTFEHLRDLAGRLLAEDYPVIVDATFLGHAQRADFIALAESRHLPWRLVSPEADLDLLRRRIAERQDRADDASEADLAVLASQIDNADPLTPEEEAHRSTFAADVSHLAPFSDLRSALGL
ncbi:MAG: AAA family ATPase [Thiobacillus sp.]|nr:AAA family ATPase [Thiobacillus sp.]